MEIEKRGFALKELFIVAVILCVIAAIVVPQFGMAKSKAKVTEMLSRLQTVRAQLELYQIQHNQTLPSAENFQAAMTTVTDVDGKPWIDSVTSGHPYGPYMRKIPENPFTGGNSIDGTGDWLYRPDDTMTECLFVADDGGVLPDGTAHRAL